MPDLRALNRNQQDSGSIGDLRGRSFEGLELDLGPCLGGTLMRHFLRGALTPAPLPGGMAAGTTTAPLVERAGPAQRLPTTLIRTAGGAVSVAAVTAQANAYLP